MADKINRNEPCPCGSEIKYKKCCLKTYRNRRKLWAAVDNIAEWTLQGDLRREFQRVRSSLGVLDESDLDMFAGGFIFAHKLPSGIFPYERYKEEHNIPKDISYALDKNIFGLFKVTDVTKGFSIDLKDLRDGEVYKVLDQEGSKGVEKGSVISARIAPLNERYVTLSHSMRCLPSPLGYTAERLMNTFEDNELKELDLIRVLLNEKEEMEETTLEDKVGILEERIRDFGISIDLSDMDERINNNPSFMDAFPEIMTFSYGKTGDFDHIMEAVIDVWNNYPRDEFGGKTPEEMWRKGPQENILTDQLFAEMEYEIDPEDYPTAEEASQALRDFSEEWLDTAQDELGGSTPREVILEERKELGDPRKEISLSMSLGQIAMEQQDAE